MSAKRLAAEEKQTRSDRRAARKQAKQANIERRWLKALAEASKMRDDGELNDEGGDDDGGGDNGFFCTPPIDEKHWMLTESDEGDDNFTYGSDDGYSRPPPQIY